MESTARVNSHEKVVAEKRVSSRDAGSEWRREARDAWEGCAYSL